ncbi:hypothetical protein [Alteromonas sp. BMJM2]|uniref:hypothetical protein n=1 Tax=Alteromonas sp. BMJM2 TaxID=2954241 RepID=UPI0022B44BE8|nr:hypothetical protein [Alteromonas sp. BMJM2]
MAVIEAEHYSAQYNASTRRWIVFNRKSESLHGFADSDKIHVEGASNNSYVELLPDTRTNHHEPLVHDVNFSATPGKMAVLTYPVYFDTAGKYYVWARAFSSGSEDNGLHVGLNNTWPSSSQRLQLCEGKHQWTWSSNQRAKDNHCGQPNTIWLDIPESGIHNVTISMREDGFELDKIILTQDADYKPEDIGPDETRRQYLALPSKETFISIEEYSLILEASQAFESVGEVPFYHDRRNNALGIDARETQYRNVWATSELTVPKKMWGKKSKTSQNFKNVILVTLGEIDGESSYRVLLNGNEIGSFVNQETTVDYQENYFDLGSLTLKPGDIITVQAKAVTNGKIPENGGTAYARGRWRGLVFQK